MKSRFLKVLISLLVIIVCIMVIEHQSYNRTHQEVSSQAGKLVFISYQKLDFDDIYSVNQKYKNFEIKILNPSDLNSYHFDNQDIVAVDNKLISNMEVKKFIQDYIKEHFILFVGPSSIEKISNELDVSFQNDMPIYAMDDGSIISKNLVDMHGEFSVLKYTENKSLKENVQIVHIQGKALPIENYLIPCLDFISETAPIQTNYVYRPRLYKYYFLDSSNHLTGTYIYTGYGLYKDTNETDLYKDYYTLKTSVCFSNDGHYLTLQHDGFSQYQATVLDKETLNDGESLSQSKAEISLKSINDLSSVWTVRKKIDLNHNYFHMDDVFEFASEYSVKEGSNPEFAYSLYALDKYANRINRATVHIDTKS